MLQPNKMVKHTQTIGRQQPTNCLSVFDHFVRLMLKRLTLNFTMLGLNVTVIVISFFSFFHETVQPSLVL